MPLHPRTVEAALLFDTPAAFRADRFLSDLNAALGPAAAPFSPTLRDLGAFAFGNGRHSLRISRHQSQLLPESLAAALGADVTRIKAFNYAAAVAAHRSALVVTVTDAPRSGPLSAAPDTPGQDQAKADIDEPRANANSGPVADAVVPGEQADPVATRLADKIRLLHRAVLVASGQARPLLVHWAQSDMLFTPDEVELTAAMPFPITLVTRPGLFGGHRDVAGKTRIGFRSYRSELFLGKTLIMEQATRPVDEMMAIADFLMLQYMAGVVRLADGDVYHLTAEEELRVRHLGPGQGLPDGSIRVRLAARKDSAAPARPRIPASRAATRVPSAGGPHPDGSQAKGKRTDAASRGEDNGASRPDATRPDATRPDAGRTDTPRPTTPRPGMPRASSTTSGRPAIQTSTRRRTR